MFFYSFINLLLAKVSLQLHPLYNKFILRFCDTGAFSNNNYDALHVKIIWLSLLFFFILNGCYLKIPHDPETLSNKRVFKRMNFWWTFGLEIWDMWLENHVFFYVQNNAIRLKIVIFSDHFTWMKNHYEATLSHYTYTFSDLRNVIWSNPTIDQGTTKRFRNFGMKYDH